MSLEGILVGVLAIAVGLAWAFYGLKAFAILLPIWAFLFGLITGASWVQEWLGDAFLGTVTSWVVGVGFGILLAVLSYFWYFAAVVLVGGSVGYLLGVGTMEALGITTGFLTLVVGVIVGAVFAAGTFLLGIPVVLIILLSAASGAAGVVNGALVLLGRIQLSDIDTGLMQGLMKEGVLGWGAWLVITVIAVAYQFRDVGRTVTAAGGPAIDRSAYRVS